MPTRSTAGTAADTAATAAIGTAALLFKGGPFLNAAVYSAYSFCFV
jgi:hypothetical protein